jgi:peptidyl-tRNA hydrolase, PTH1 family
MNILVGLGNSGEKYIATRHNVGRDFLIWFAKKHNFSDFKKDSFLNALVSQGEFQNNQYILILPETYMNLSGQTVKNISNKWTETEKEDVLIIHDDIDINFGELKVSKDAGHGGHNGIKSIQQETKENFTRIRIGICPKTFLGGFKKPHKDNVADFVLKKFGMMERREVENIFGKVEKSL